MQLIATLEAYLMERLSSKEAATEFLHRLPDIYHRCNQNIYDRPMVAEAYAYTHLISRYCNWWDAFSNMLDAGWLPMRESGLRALDVGAGPGAATYALLDFFRALDESVLGLGLADSDDLTALVTPRPDVVMVEASESMSHLVHRISEERKTGGPYEARYRDFFGLRLARTWATNATLREAFISNIMDEWDTGWEGAEWHLREEYSGWHEPERYHLCMISHFLTTDSVLSRAADALQGVKATLPPGGIIAVVGSIRRSATYDPIYKELERQMNGLHHLAISGPYASVVDDQSQARLNQFYQAIRRRIDDRGVDVRSAMAHWPPGIEKVVTQRWNPNNKIVLPPYTLEVFRARHHRMGSGSRQQQKLGIRASIGSKHARDDDRC